MQHDCVACCDIAFTAHQFQLFSRRASRSASSNKHAPDVFVCSCVRYSKYCFLCWMRHVLYTPIARIILARAVRGECGACGMRDARGESGGMVCVRRGCVVHVTCAWRARPFPCSARATLVSYEIRCSLPAVAHVVCIARHAHLVCRALGNVRCSCDSAVRDMNLSFQRYVERTWHISHTVPN